MLRKVIQLFNYLKLKFQNDNINDFDKDDKELIPSFILEISWVKKSFNL